MSPVAIWVQWIVGLVMPAIAVGVVALFKQGNDNKQRLMLYEEKLSGKDGVSDTVREHGEQIDAMKGIMIGLGKDTEWSRSEITRNRDFWHDIVVPVINQNTASNLRVADALVQQAQSLVELAKSLRLRTVHQQSTSRTEIEG